MTSHKKDEFSRDFQDLLVRERVPEKARPYYLRHLERWGAAFRQRPAGISKKDSLEGYLNKLSHTGGVEPFMVCQTAEVVRLMREGNYALRTEENYLQWVVSFSRCIRARP